MIDENDPSLSRHTSREALLASEMRYRRLFEAAQDGILILDAGTGRIVDANPFMVKMLDYSLEEFLGKELWQIGLFKDVEASKIAFEALKAAGYIRYDDLPLKTATGRRVAVEFVSNSYLVGNETVIQCNIRETTERKATEDALRESERLIRNLLDHLPHRILVKDRNSIVIFCNSNYATDVGLTADEVIGTNAFDFHPEALAQAYHADDREVIETGVVKSLEEPYHYDGHEGWVHTVKLPYRDELGNIQGVLVVFEDITDRRSLEDQLRQSQKLEGVGQLAGGVAHDFNNLLTVVLGHCELMKRSLNAQDPLLANVEQIRHCGERAATLTRQLLAFSRRQVLQVRMLDLNALVRDIDTMLQRIISENIKLQLSLAPDLFRIKADPGQIEQVIVNLVVNARDAMPDGGQLTIATSNVVLDEEYAGHHVAVTPGDYVMLTVTDSGCGMDAATAKRIFEPFFTTKEVGKGTGLGLSTVYGIVKQSGGSIWSYSEVGHGTTFKIYLPRSEATAIADVHEPLAPLEGGTETVLLAEDDEAVRNLIVQILVAEGYAVVATNDGAKALEAFVTDGNIDLVLTDVMMPDMGGKELVKKLEAIRPGVKVLFMSGYAGDAAMLHGMLDAGANYMQKPFTRDALARKVRELLDR